MLALEAECQRNPSNAEAWRLLGTVQAENDDDQQAIAAMNRCAWEPHNFQMAGCGLHQPTAGSSVVSGHGFTLDVAQVGLSRTSTSALRPN